jgi:hypothetical protein
VAQGLRKTGQNASFTEMSSTNTFRLFPLMAVLMLICVAALSVTESPAQSQQIKPQGNVLNPYGAPVGAVDENGVVTTPYGSKVGHVDPDGNVYNVSSIFIGKLDPNGDIFNQAGDYLGYVDTDGSVYNVSEFKVGSVQAGGDVFLAGGAARIIFFKASKGVGSKPRPMPRPR